MTDDEHDEAKAIFGVVTMIIVGVGLLLYNMYC
jgi:hypothetical protein